MEKREKIKVQAWIRCDFVEGTLYSNDPICKVFELFDEETAAISKRWYKYFYVVWVDKKFVNVNQDDKTTTFSDLGVSGECVVHITEVMRNVSPRQLLLDREPEDDEQNHEEDW